MAKLLDMPKLSPTMEEGVLSVWHKKEGDSVEVDDLLAEVETDKATMEFRAFDRGTLLKLLVAPQSMVKLGQPVAIVGSPGEDIAALVATAAAGTTPIGAQRGSGTGAGATGSLPDPSASSASITAAETPTQTQTNPSVVYNPGIPARVSTGSPLDRTEREASDLDTALPAFATGRVLASPYVRKLARERGVDLHGATGTGPGGRVTPTDVESGALARGPLVSGALAVPPTQTLTKAPSSLMLAAPESRPLSPMRKTIARRLTESKSTVPHFYLNVDVAADRLVAFRTEINHELETAGQLADGDKPFKISINDLLIKACAVALTRVPECNAQFAGNAILVHRRVDISVAVAVSEGLVTPVVRNADQKGVLVIAHEVRELALRARAKKLRPEEMMDGTFSISNLGMFGIDSFSAVINPPEGAILAVGQVRDEATVRDGQVVAGQRLAVTLSCDHRVVDGAVGAAFLAELRALLEHPMRVVLG